MKTRSIILTVFAIFATAAFPAKGENVVRQTLLNSGLQYDLITDNDSGNGSAFHPITGSDGGMSFELFARGSAWDNNLYFLDRKIVGFYMPEATIDVWSQDWSHDWFNPESPPRTRADQPYTLAIHVWGLLSDPTVHLAAQQVLYTHVGENYNIDYVPNGDGEYTLASFLMGNQDPSFNPVYTQLTPMAPTKAMGIEKFTISTLTDATVPESAILDEEYMVVWPVSEAQIAGVEQGGEIRDSLPNIVATYRDLYPLSMTYIQIYPGPESLGTNGQLFGSSLRWHNTTVPQNEIISIENWEDMIPTDGEYTIEVLSITPFNWWQPERLSHVTFDVNRKVKVNGQVTTSEK